MTNKPGQLSKVISVLVLCAFILPLTMCLEKPVASSAGTKKPRLPRYERCEDGIWRLKDSKNTADADKTDGGKSAGKAADTGETVKTNKITGEPVGERTAVCMFTGDLMCLAGQQYDAGRTGKYDFYPSFKYVDPILKSADLVCGNLETLLSESNPITRVQKYENEQPQCNGPESYLNALKKAGFDMLVTANNHTCDWGPTGITETKRHLDDAGFANAGTHYNINVKKPDTAKSGSSTGNEMLNDQAGERYSIFEANGIKIAILSYTHLMNQRAKMTSAEMKTMVHLFDRDTVEKDIADAKEAGAEFVAVYLHFGSENVEDINSTQSKDAQFVAEAGADLIIGSHPHCLQKCAYLKTSDKRKVLCMYSMGNFVSSMARDINNDTIILRVEITKTIKRKKIEVTMTDASYIPCKVLARDGRSFVVMPTNKGLNGGLSYTSLKEAHDRIAAVLGKAIREYTS